MSEQKTVPSNESVNKFLNSIDDPEKRSDCLYLLEIMKNITRENPRLWSNSIVGFGEYHYKYESGHEGKWFLTGFAPRSKNISIYIMAGFENEPLMKNLGKFKTGKSCLYVNRLSDIDEEVLKHLVIKSVKFLKDSTN